MSRLLLHRLLIAVRGVRRALWRHAGRFLAAPPSRFGQEARRARPTEYLVRWEILVEAASPEEAVEEALAVQRNPDSRATLFDVRDEWGRWRTIVGDGPRAARRLQLVKRPAS
jgi:hypothetical protein